MANAESKSSLIIPGQGPREATASCWSCGTTRAAQFCNSCGKVQPPVPVDYFTFFGFPRKLNLDTAELEKEFYALSRRLHPDMFAQANPEERAFSLEQSSMLNDAYRTLKDPIKRTEYLLRIEGVEIEEQSKQATEKARNRRIEKAGRASGSSGGSFRTQHASGRTSRSEKDGRRRSSLAGGNRQGKAVA